MIDHLVEKFEVDPNEFAEKNEGFDAQERGGDPLHVAARYGRVRAVKNLVEKHNVDILKMDYDGYAALYVAEEEGKTACAAVLRELTCKQLLAGGCDGVGMVGLLVSAGSHGDDAMIDLLVEKCGVDPNGAGEYDGWTALHHAANLGHVRTVKHLVEKHNVDIHKTDEDGYTALDVAERNGMTECADYLYALTYTQLLAGEYRGDVDMKLLMSAARRGDDAMIDLLVERYGVDPNGADRWGCTALHEAVEYGRVRTVKHLVEKHNADIHKRSLGGNTALNVAVRNGRTECADYLRALQSTRPPPS